MCTICSHHETRGAASDPWQTFILRLFNQLKEECCVRAAVFDSSVSGSVVLQPAACLCSVNATAHAQIRRLELCTFSAQFSPFLLTFIAPSARRSTHNSLRDAAHDDVRADPLAGEWKAVCFMFHCLQKKILKNP